VYKVGHDISWPLLDREWRVEVKARASGCRTLYRWLDGRDAAVIKADRERWLLVVEFINKVIIFGRVPLLDAIPVMKRAEGNK
jgi:hypothetical protein